MKHLIRTVTIVAFLIVSLFQMQAKACAGSGVENFGFIFSDNHFVDGDDNIIYGVNYLDLWGSEDCFLDFEWEKRDVLTFDWAATSGAVIAGVSRQEANLTKYVGGGPISNETFSPYFDSILNFETGSNHYLYLFKYSRLADFSDR